MIQRDPLHVLAVICLCQISAGQQALTAPTPVDSNVYGLSLDLDGGTAAVGEPNVPSYFLNFTPGAVHTYQQSAVGWALQQTVVAYDGVVGDRFGCSVALDGDWLAVGACEATVANQNEGAVYIFESVGGSWLHHTKLAGTVPDGGFGRVLVLDGGTLAVGVPDQEQVLLYKHQAGSWLPDGVLVSPVTASEFGWSVALRNDDLLVGAPDTQGLLNSQPGEAVLYRRVGGAWTEIDQLTGPSSEPDGFGWAVAMGDRVVVGAPAADGSFAEQGAAYVFEESGGSWGLVQTITATDPEKDGGFGISLSIQGDLLGIGAHQYLSFPKTKPFVESYLMRAGAYSFSQLFDLPNVLSDNYFADKIALDGRHLLVAEPFANWGPTFLGKPSGLAFDVATGTLYGIEVTAGTLYTVGGVAGGRNIGLTGIAKPRGLAVDPVTSQIYVADDGTDTLFSVDASTAAASAIGPLGFGGVLSLEYHAGLGVLIGVDVDTDQLLHIDPLTAAATAVAPLSYQNVRGLAYDGTSDVLYGVDRWTKTVFEVDPVTGFTIQVGTTPEVALALGFDPTAGLIEGIDEDQVRFQVDPQTGVYQSLGDLTIDGAGVVWSYDLDFTASYCTAGTSSSGCSALLSAQGLASANDPDGFELRASNADGNRWGLFFFGTSGQQAQPWGSSSSFQCVVPPVVRTGIVQSSGTTGGCDGLFDLDLNSVWCPTCPKSAKNPGAGALVQAQLWYRDPASTSNRTSSLSDAIEFVVGP